jgi:hypothetical protein
VISQSTIYEFGDVVHEKVEIEHADSTWERIVVRLKQTGVSRKDTVDLTLDRYHAKLLAEAILKECVE